MVHFEDRFLADPGRLYGLSHASHDIMNSKARATIPRAFFDPTPYILYFSLTRAKPGFNLKFNTRGQATFNFRQAF